MHGLSSGTGRFAPPKIEFKCSCGKRYRVAASKAGRAFRCKRCRIKVSVPGSRKISMRSRKAILAEFGIDAEQAQKAYEVEKEQSYACAVCATKLAEDQLKDAYGAEGLICSSCRAAQVAEREIDSKKEKKKKKEKQQLERWARGTSAGEAKAKAFKFGALFFVGTCGFVHSFFGPAAWITGGVALAVAGLGGRAIFNAEYTPYEPEEEEEA